MDSATVAPFTVNELVEGFGEYNLSGVAISNVYVPLGSVKDTVLDVEENVCPLVRLTYHFVVDGRPDSVKATEYVTRENVTDSERGAPATVNDPDDGDGAYSLLFVAIV